MEQMNQNRLRNVFGWRELADVNRNGLDVCTMCGHLCSAFLHIKSIEKRIPLKIFWNRWQHISSSLLLFLVDRMIDWMCVRL